MTAKLLLRIAAIVILVHLIGHTFGHFSWETPIDDKLNEIIESMKSYKTNFMGAARSMADYYQGYSLMFIGWYAMSVVMLWILSNNVQYHKSVVSALSLTIGVFYLFFGIAEWIYFFPFASIISLIAGATLLLAAKAKN